MLPELLRFSSAHKLLESIPDELQAHHRVPGAPVAVPPMLGRTQTAKRLKSEAEAEKASKKSNPHPERVSMWDGWVDADDEATTASFGGEDALDLSALGL